MPEVAVSRPLPGWPDASELQRDQGASPSPSGSQESANTPSNAIEGSGIGEASASSAHSST